MATLTSCTFVDTSRIIMEYKEFKIGTLVA